MIEMEKIILDPIGIVHSPYFDQANTPRQSIASDEVGEIEIFPEYEKGLRDLDGFSHIIVLFHFSQNEGYSLDAHPPMETQVRGVFSTRSPRRPNLIGMSIVRLLEVNGCHLKIQGLDMLDGTPVVDIKPYTPALDDRARETVKVGWQAGMINQS